MNSSKKLIYIANLRLPTEKAYGIQIAKMCEAFALLKFKVDPPAGRPGSEKLKITDVELIAPTRKNNIKQDFFEYYNVKKNFKFKLVQSPDFYWPGFLDRLIFYIKNYFSAKALVNEALKEGADFYYTRDELVAKILKKKNKNVIFECHRFSNNRRSFYSYFKKTNLKIAAISSGLKDDLIKFGINSSNVLVAPDGVDLEEFNIDLSREEARKLINLPTDKKIVMYAGHLFEWKGTDVLLEVARNFQKNNDLLFVFVGGTEYDIEKFKEKTSGLDNILILGHRPHKEIPIYLKSADVLVLPNSAKEEISRFYTSPLKLFEYMASKRPIVASGTPAIKEILNNSNSIIVEPDRPDLLADDIRMAIAGGAEVDQLCQSAFSEVQNYTWQKRAGNILDFI